MTGLRENGLTPKEQLFRTLRRKILAGRLKVTLDEQLSRETSSAVRSLAGMDLSRIAKRNRTDAETDQRLHELTRKEQLFRTLRREILAARLKDDPGRATGPRNLFSGENVGWHDAATAGQAVPPWP